MKHYIYRDHVYERTLQSGQPWYHEEQLVIYREPVSAAIHIVMKVPSDATVSIEPMNDYWSRIFYNDVIGYVPRVWELIRLKHLEELEPPEADRP